MRHRRIPIILIVSAVVLFCVSAWFAYPYVSFKERFRRSRPALDSYAAKVAASGPAALANPPSQLGYFKVVKMEPLPGGFLFQSDFGNPFD
jgi:hypothetical protein